MKLGKIITMSLLAVLLTGCAENSQKSQDTGLANAELVNSYNDIAIQNAIIAEHTLFPYHFVNNSAGLNELGQRDLAVLTKHFMEHPGSLSIRRGDIPAELYEARVKLVLDRWKAAGINMKRVDISDDMPGGPGMTSEKIIKILERESKPSGTKMTTIGISGAGSTEISGTR